MQIVWTLSLFALLLGICQAQVITVQVFNKPGTTQATVIVDGVLRIECLVKNISANAELGLISWNHNGAIVNEGGDISIMAPDAITGSEIESELRIRDVTLDDAGIYECVVELTMPTVSLRGSVTISVEVELTVVGGDEQEAEVGDTVTLLCNVSSSFDPLLTWYKLRTDGTRTQILEQAFGEPWFGNLTITNVTREDNGTYICEASNLFGDKEDMVDLIVLIPPGITSDPVIDREVQKESTIELNCNASGVRDPTYKWLFNGKELRDDNRTEVDPVSGELMIEDAVFADTGVYTCFAENSAGNDSQNNTIVIVGSPEIQLPLQEGNETEEEVVGRNQTAVLSCPYIAQPDGMVTWMFRAVGEDDFQNVTGDGIQLFNDNGTLVLTDSQVENSGTYLCSVRNRFGVDSRKFTLSVIALELPAAPDSFTVTAAEEKSRFVTLTWTQPPPSSPSREVDNFVVEVMENNKPWRILVQPTFPSTVTSGNVLLLPGIKYKIRLRARNFAGLSPPSIEREYETVGEAPQLILFNAEAQKGGRSVLLTWELEFTGGPPVEDLQFTITITVDGGEVRQLQPNISLGEYLVTGLDPETLYKFTARISNVYGQSSVDTDATTILAPPSKPTKPNIDDLTALTITLTFSVDFGSAPITQFILDTMEGGPVSEPRNLNDTNSTRITYISLKHDDLDLKGRVGENGSVVGYDVKLEVNGLEKDTDYVFAVAAENAIGIGEFSDNSDSVSLESRDNSGATVYGGIVMCVVAMVSSCVLQ